ncbi:MAG TPA: EAL domain-containing protein [Rhodocyclaceae bacterium]|uniref:EAL domain-containing protein n=1 Tax=Zoogloea sp. TaxID=49181 RepID=UPI002CE49851|nr:EAL domain-containing protein [Zoogloea sp.]HMV17403.1 EAL domain-containing protein [Rhodocyclaceae bacterium]HMW53193.1 EAL domain-containing protein [Rhodocyclaceae bacterium]HMY48830.1 EAL domain-containing protein [Rhodocyclaceae bacterium]HNB65999.1 EAL domain-containing protein [Rhodocyclaceae bacterium]HNC80860.1 EAL domain-containing protein [Rhodocyclaceae bacterium]
MLSNLSIRVRLLLASTVVQVVMLTLLLTNSARLMNEATGASLETLISQNAAILNIVTASFVPQGRYAELQDALGELLNDSSEGLVYVRIVDASGHTQVRAGMPDLATLPPPDNPATLTLPAGESRNVINIRRPLLMDRNQVGFLQFGVSVSALTVAKQQILSQGLFIATAEVLLTLLLLGTIGYLMTRNLGRLLRGSQAIAAGDLSHRIPEKGQDELAQLCKHFNRMALALQSRIHELEATARQLAQSEERYALATRAANDGLWDWDIVTGKTYFAPRFAEILGITPDAFVGDRDTLFKHIHPEDREAFRLRLVAHLKRETAQLNVEHRIRHADGSYRWTLTCGMAVYDPDSGRAIRMAGSISDIHLRRRAEDQLVHDALHDGLTGLANRALFVEHLQNTLRHADRVTGSLFAVLHVNIERFHVVNDSLGYSAGDDLLRLVGQRIQALARPGDVVGRVGGDQFALLLNDIADASEAIRFSENLQTRLAESAELNGHSLYPKTRIGVALGSGGFHNAEDLMRDADNAMHRSRSSSDSTITVFQSTMHQQALRDLQLESQLRIALQEGQFVAHYQPIVHLADGRTAGFEALVRWPEQATRRIGPDVFVPLAESLDLIHELGMHMLDQSCAQLKAWRTLGLADGDLSISVNLSARQLMQVDLADQVVECIERHELPPSALKLEITEGTLVTRKELATSQLGKLRAKGLKILIDDFGTGYSSLSYLHTIPCDTLKLDGSFIREIERDTRLRAIVGATIRLSHELGISVVAECIETPAQAQLLRDLGCDYGQGYLFSSAQPGDKAQQWLLNNLPVGAGA